MKTIESLKAILDADNTLSVEDKQAVLDSSEVLYQLNEFLKTKYSLTDEGVSHLTVAYVREHATDPGFEHLAEVHTAFAKLHGFEKAEELSESILKILTILNHE